MSADAYREIYGQEPPPGAHFGADISWWQDTAVWDDLVNWAEWVTIRCSYGRTGDDGRQDDHVAAAEARGYTGKLGGYHFYYAGDPAAQVDNYLSRSANIRDRFTHHMVDAEASPVAPIGEMVEWCDRVEQATQQPAEPIYAGWNYLNQAGSTTRPLWLPHYASARYVAWSGCPGSWDLYRAPWTPDWFGERNPTIWQFGSLTARHGHLDVNIGTQEAADLLGLDGGDDMAELTGRSLELLEAVYRSTDARATGWVFPGTTQPVTTALEMMVALYQMTVGGHLAPTLAGVNYNRGELEQAEQQRADLLAAIRAIPGGTGGGTVDVAALAAALVAEVRRQLCGGEVAGEQLPAEAYRRRPAADPMAQPWP